MLKSFLKKLFTRAVSTRPTTIRRAPRLGCELFEARIVPSVSSVDITSIVATGDRDGNLTDEHVQITAGTAVNVSFNYTVGGTANTNWHAEIWDSGFHTLLKTGVSNGVNNEAAGGHSGTVAVDTTGLAPGNYGVKVVVTHQGNGSNSDDNSVSIYAHATPTIPLTALNTTYNGFAYNGASVGSFAGDSFGTTTLNYSPGGSAPTNAGTYTVTASYVSDGQIHGFTQYDNTSASKTLAIGQATATVSPTNYAGVYDAQAHTAGVVITGVNGETLASNAVTGTNVADSTTVTASIAGLQNYKDATGTAALAITRATATVAVSNYSGTYDGQAHTASVTVTGVGGETATNSITGANVADSGSATAALTDPGNYSNATTGTATLAITRATATVSADAIGTTYDGQAHTATVTITGVGGESATNAVTATDAGSYSAFAGLSDPDNYDGPSSGTATLAIGQATATVSPTGYAGVYDAQAHTAGVVITGVNGETLASNAVTGTNVADSTTVAASIAGLQNYKDATGSAALTITRATATVAVSNYSGTYDGQAHTASVTVTGVGGETATNSITGANVADSGSATAALTDPDNYDGPSSGTATLAIGQATATVTPTNYSGTYDGQAHTASVTITGVGGVVLASNSVSRTNPGASSTSASITGLANYKDASGTATVTVTTAAPSASLFSSATQGAVNVGKKGTLSVTLTAVNPLAGNDTLAALGALPASAFRMTFTNNLGSKVVTSVNRSYTAGTGLSVSISDVSVLSSLVNPAVNTNANTAVSTTMTLEVNIGGTWYTISTVTGIKFFGKA